MHCARVDGAARVGTHVCDDDDAVRGAIKSRAIWMKGGSKRITRYCVALDPLFHCAGIRRKLGGMRFAVECGLSNRATKTVAFVGILGPWVNPFRSSAIVCRLLCGILSLCVYVNYYSP